MVLVVVVVDVVGGVAVNTAIFFVTKPVFAFQKNLTKIFRVSVTPQTELLPRVRPSSASKKKRTRSSCHDTKTRDEKENRKGADAVVVVDSYCGVVVVRW